MKGIPVLSSFWVKCETIQYPLCLMPCSTSCFYLHESAPLALPLDLMGYAGFIGKSISETRWAAISCFQRCLENRCNLLLPPAQSGSFYYYPILYFLPASSMPLLELCCASGSVPNYLKAIGEDDESSFSLSSLWSSSPHTSFNLWQGYA